MPQLESIPTVNAILIQGQQVKVLLSQSETFDTTSIEFIPNAQIELFVNNLYTETLSYIDLGFYHGNTIVEAGNTYKCKVVVPNSDTLICEDKIPFPEKIIDIKHYNIAGKDEEGTTYPALQLTFSNKPETTTYYEIQISLFTYDDEIKTPKILNIVDPLILNEGLPILLFSNEIIDNTTYTMHINYNTGSSFSSNNSGFRATLYPLIIELRTVSYNYYRYCKQFYLYKHGLYADGIIENMTAFPNYSNVENGRGIFAGFSSAISDTLNPAYEY